jgi:hypothetical protein
LETYHWRNNPHARIDHLPATSAHDGRPDDSCLAGYEKRADSTCTALVYELTLNDFRHTLHLSYGVTLSQWTRGYASTINEQSSAAVVDTSACGSGGACDAGSDWLGIYHSIGDAQAEYNGFLNWSSQQRGHLEANTGTSRLAQHVYRCR